MQFLIGSVKQKQQIVKTNKIFVSRTTKNSKKNNLFFLIDVICYFSSLLIDF